MKGAFGKTAKEEVRLDPLFDYSKTRRPTVILDDDDDNDVQILTPSEQNAGEPQPNETLSKFDNADAGKERLAAVADDGVTTVGANDWLEPPPSKPASHTVLPADPTLLRLRLQKEALQRIVRTSEESVKNIERTVRLEPGATTLLPQEHPGAHALRDARPANAIPEEAPCKRQKILLKLQGSNEEVHSIKFYADDKFEKLFSHFVEKAGKGSVRDCVFLFDGQHLNPNSRPKDLDLEDGDIIEFFPRGAKR